MTDRNRTINPILQPKPEAAGCVSPAEPSAGSSRQQQAARREQLPSPEDRLRLRFRWREHLENAQETAQDGRALGWPWSCLWPAGQRPGDQTDGILGATMAGLKGISGLWFMLRPGLPWERTGRGRLLSCRTNRIWTFLSSPAPCRAGTASRRRNTRPAKPTSG